MITPFDATPSVAYALERLLRGRGVLRKECVCEIILIPNTTECGVSIPIFIIDFGVILSNIFTVPEYQWLAQADTNKLWSYIW